MPLPAFTRLEPDLSESDVLAFEDHIGFALPKNYRDHLKWLSGAEFASNACEIYNRKEAIGLQNFVSVSDLRNLRNEIEDFPAPALPIIATDEGDFCVILEGKGDRVYFWDHETAVSPQYAAKNVQELFENCSSVDIDTDELERDVVSVWIDPEFAKKHIKKP